MTRRRWCVLGTVLLLAATACESRTGLDAETGGPPATRSAPVQERAARLELPAGFDRPFVEFSDANTGYALANKCASGSCEARLFGTRDGGRSWQPRTHPRPMAENHQLYAGAGQTVVLLAEPHSWYVSRDGGGTWQARPYDRLGGTPPEYHSRGGQFYADCERPDGACVVRDSTVGPQWSQEPPKEFRRGFSLANGKDGRVWLAAIHDGRPRTAVSEIGVRAFTSLDVPDLPKRKLMSASVMISADGRDVWLVALPEPAGGSGGGGGRSWRAAARKATGLPLVWQYQQGAWVAFPIRGITEQANHPYSVAAAGKGLLAIAGPDVSGYVDRGRYVAVPGAPRLEWIGHLGDGTLVGRAGNDTYLCTGDGRQRQWHQVVITSG